MTTKSCRSGCCPASISRSSSTTCVALAVTIIIASADLQRKWHRTLQPHYVSTSNGTASSSSTSFLKSGLLRKSEHTSSGSLKTIRHVSSTLPSTLSFQSSSGRRRSKKDKKIKKICKRKRLPPYFNNNSNYPTKKAVAKNHSNRAKVTSSSNSP